MCGNIETSIFTQLDTIRLRLDILVEFVFIHFFDDCFVLFTVF
jgi:hypothetical protein